MSGDEIRAPDGDGGDERTSSPRWWLIVLLLVGLLILDAAVLVAYHRGQLRDALFVPLSLAVSQIALLTIWSALGGTPAPVRLFAVVLGVIVWARLLCGLHRPDPPELARMTVILLAEAIFVGLPLAYWRLKGLQVVRLAEEPRADTAASRQFSLGYLMAWMTCVAVVLGLVKYCVDPTMLPRDYNSWEELAVAGVFELMLAGVCLYAALGRRFIVPPFLILGCLCILVVCIFVWPGLGMRGGQGTLVALVAFAQIPLILAPLYVVRVAGFRIARPK